MHVVTFVQFQKPTYIHSHYCLLYEVSLPPMHTRTGFADLGLVFILYGSFHHLYQVSLIIIHDPNMFAHIHDPNMFAHIHIPDLTLNYQLSPLTGLSPP